MSLEKDYLKISIISNILMLEGFLSNLVPYEFEMLWELDKNALEDIRDELLEQYAERS